MKPIDLARSVAADLGPQTLAALKRPTTGSQEKSAVTGDVPIPKTNLADASFLLACSERAMAFWQVKPERIALIEALYGEIMVQPSDQRFMLPTDTEQRLRLIARVVDKLAPQGRHTKDFHSPIVLQPFKDMKQWIVRQAINWTAPEFAGNGWPDIHVPAGFVSDLASVPQALHWVVHPSGAHGHAAILHDWFYWEQSVTREIADRVFDIAMEELGVNVVLRNSMWAVVRVAGGWAWDSNAAEKMAGGKRILKQFPDSPNISWDQWRLEPGVFA